MASTASDGTVRIWPLDRPDAKAEILGSGGGDLRALAISPDGRRLAAGGLDGTVRVWHVGPEGERAKPLVKDHGSEVLSLGFDFGGRFLASGGTDGKARLWPLDRTDDPPITLDARTSRVRALVFSRDGKFIAVSSRFCVLLWDLGHLHMKPRKLPHLSQRVHTLAVSPSGGLLAVGTAEGTIWVWDLTRPDEELDSPAILEGHEDVVRSLAFSPVMNLLASASDDATVRLWELTPSGSHSILRGHDNEVRTVAFHPDGLDLASGGG